MRINYPDGFGTNIAPCRELSSDTLKAFFRFNFDGVIEGISEGLLSGEADEESMRYFGLIT